MHFSSAFHYSIVFHCLLLSPVACSLYRVPLYGELPYSVYNSLHMHASISMIIQTQKSVHKSNGFDNTIRMLNMIYPHALGCRDALSWVLHADVDEKASDEKEEQIPEGFCQTLESETERVDLEGVAAAPPVSLDNIHHYLVMKRL